MRNGTLAADHMKHALRMARAFKRLFPWIDVSDLEGAAVDGLIAAALAYDDRGVPFWAYARQRVWGKMLDLVEWLNRRPPCHCLSQADSLCVSMVDPPNHRMLHELVALLPDQQQRFVGLRYFDGTTQVAAAAECGVKYKTAGTFEGHILRALRAELALRGVRRLADAL